MPFVTGTILAAGAAVGGLALQAKGASDSAKASKAQADASARAENLRQQQAQLQAQREQRKIFQDAQRQRANANATLAAQGASSSSAEGGAFASIAGSEAAQTVALGENLALGNGIFDANRANAYAGADRAIGQGEQSIGQSLFAASNQIGTIGSTLFGPTPKGA